MMMMMAIDGNRFRVLTSDRIVHQVSAAPQINITGPINGNCIHESEPLGSVCTWGQLAEFSCWVIIAKAVVAQSEDLIIMY